MFYLGKIGFAASCKTPESSKLIAISSFIQQAWARIQGAGEPRVPGSEGCGDPKVNRTWSRILRSSHSQGPRAGTRHRGFPKCVGFAIVAKFSTFFIRIQNGNTAPSELSDTPAGVPQWPCPSCASTVHFWTQIIVSAVGSTDGSHSDSSPRMAFYTDALWQKASPRPSPLPGHTVMLIINCPP